VRLRQGGAGGRVRLSGWRTIASAPRDGTRILGYGSVGFLTERSIATVAFIIGKHGDGHFVCDPNEATHFLPEPCHLTHWMPLPEPPR